MMSLQMAGRCARKAADVVGPTPERLRRDRFRTTNGVTRIVNTVQVLRDAGDICDDEVSAATRWYRDYVFAQHGVVEADAAHPAETERGDVHTWMLGRGKSAVRISDVKAALGLCGHVRLQMMLGQEMSFSAMARILYPGDSDSRARMKVSAQCSFLLEQLATFYRTRTSKRKQKLK
ncbi:hypothetical protein [Tanticharoenia sakaeratensis]|nr:hypothetical protein [Tanticharoenia sakaeratensis]